MTGLVARSSRRARILALAMLASVSASNFAVGAGIEVVLDQAKVIKIPERATTVVIGNPLIADISVQTGGMVVVTGKGYGATNIIALDQRGAILMEDTIQVRGPNEHVVVVFRGVDRESYSCTPKCERRITLGDSTAYFDAVIAQTGRRDGQAGGAGSAPQR